MPYPAQIDSQRIIQAAYELVERDGEDHVSLARLAAALRVRAPSLYRYFKGRNDLLRAVNAYTLEGLFAALQVECADRSSLSDPLELFLCVADAYRDFALAHPRTYQLAMASAVNELRPDEDFLLRLALPLQAGMAAVSGEENSLTALRGAFALVHGFVMLELTHQLRRGGDLGTAFQQSVRAYLQGWQAQRARHDARETI